MNDRNLPAGWVTTTLDSLCLPVDKVAPRKDAPDQPFTYLDITSIDNKTFRVVSPKIYMGRDAPSRARQKVRRGNTLFSTVRTYLKNIAMVPPEFDGEVASTGFCVLNPACGVDQKFIFYLVLNDEFTSNLNPLQRGTSYPAVRNDDVLAQEILLPPLAEQHRIVAAIEQHLTRLAAAVTALKQVQANLQRYRTASSKLLAKASWSPPRRRWPAPKAATTSTPTVSWRASWSSAAPAGRPSPSAAASTRSRPRPTRPPCRGYRRGGHGRV